MVAEPVHIPRRIGDGKRDAIGRKRLILTFTVRSFRGATPCKQENDSYIK
jgi:hypothetical protein